MARFKSDRYLYLVVLLAAGLRLLKLTVLARPMWFDETFTAWLAQLSPLKLVAATAIDVHPPLYYLIEWTTVQVLGSSPWALRLPSAIFGTLAVWLAYRLFVILNIPRPVTYLATLGMAVLPVQLHYSTEARMYTLLLALSIWAAIELKQNHFGRFALVGLLMMYTHNAAAFTLAGLGLWWLGWAYPTWFKYVKQWALVLCVIGLGYAAWAVVVLEQSQANWWLEVTTPGMVIQTLDFLFWFEGVQGFYTLHTGVLTLGLLVTGWIWLARNGYVNLIIPPLGTMSVSIIVSLLAVPVFLNRSFIGITPWLYLAAAWGLWQIWLGLPRVVVYAGILPVLILGIVGYQVKSVSANPVDQLLSTVDLQPGDVCYHFNVASLVFFRYYFPDCDHWLWAGRVDVLLNSKSQAAMGMQRAELSTLPKKWSRAWLFVNNDPFVKVPSEDTIQQEAARNELQQHPEAVKVLPTVHQVTTSHLIKNEVWLVQHRN